MTGRGNASLGMGDRHRTYIAIETTISVFINGSLSLLFAWLVFSGCARVDLWGVHGLAVDFVPQSFMIALMGTVVPTLLTRSRLAQGKLTTMAARHLWLPSNLLVRGLTMAIGSTLIGGGIAVLQLTILMSEPVSIFAVYAIKLGYGCLLAAIVTRMALLRALSEISLKSRQR